MVESILNRILDFLARRLILYFSKIPVNVFTNDPYIKDLVLKISCTPVIFGGGIEKVVLGQNVKLVNTLLNVASGSICIGDNTFFGHNVMVITGTHEVMKTGIERHDYPETGRDIRIGRGVWIASGAIILGPCEIGDNTVVSAGSVVCGGILEPNSVYAGIPARKIRHILST
jgi:acetyltransferase-like isoleucine patch superfamily enzyme